MEATSPRSSSATTALLLWIARLGMSSQNEPNSFRGTSPKTFRPDRV